MNPRLSDAKSIFLQAIESYSAEQWPVFLDGACAGDDELRDQVERLLVSHASLGTFHENADHESAATFLASAAPEAPGAQIGPYKIREQLGEGGMGIVYVAEQTEPVRRKVALKIIKPGMDSKEVVARFEAERQALAMMSHPNIAKVLDGGTTDNGRPYFVMELVKGIPITKFCDEQKLGVRQRLELFITVCQAVQHAHQKGIIHRDLKPSNVLVELHDVTPVPKVIDFGIAKATNQQLTQHTIYTQFSQLVGTPLYMSPEQAQLSGIDVDTRSDVYSLGVMLYELLTGVTPFNESTLSSVGLDEMRRIIREDEPPRPSQKVSTLANEHASTVSQSRRSDPRKLALSMRRELDWIVMHALEKDRTRRYESASAFAADVQRYLDDEPVQACPPSMRYRLRKLARRHKVTLITTALVVASMVAGAAVSIRQARRAIESEGLAIESKRRAIESERLAQDRLAQSQRSFAKSLEAIDHMLTRVSDQLADTPKFTRVRQALLEDALKLCRDLIEDNPDDPRVRYQAARICSLLAHVRYVLGDKSEGKRLSHEAYSECERLLQKDPANPQYVISFANVCNQLAWQAADRKTRLALDRKAVAMLESLVDQHPANAEYRFQLVKACGVLGVHVSGADRQAAVENLQRAIKLGESIPDVAWGGVAGSYRDYARLLRSQHKTSEAAEAFRKAIATFRHGLNLPRGNLPLEECQHFRTCLAACYYEYGEFLNSTGETQPAEQAYQTSIRQFEQLHADFPDYQKMQTLLARSQSGLIRLLIQTGRPDEAAHIIEELSPQTAQEYLDRAGLHEILSEYNAARDDYDRALELKPDDSHALLKRAEVFSSLNQWKLAIEDYTRTIELDPEDASAYLHRANAYTKLSLLEEAVADYHAVIDLSEKNFAALKHSPKEGSRLNSLYARMGESLQRVGRTTEAEAVFRRAFEIAENLTTNDSGNDYYWLQYIDSARRLIDLLNSTARQDEVDIILAQLTAIEPRSPAVLARRGTMFARISRNDEALADFKKAVELDQTWMLYNTAAWYAARYPANSPAFSRHALKWAKKAVELSPQTGTIWNTLGVAQYRAGKSAEAIKSLQKSMDLRDGGNAFDWFFLAMAHAQLGQKEEARRWFDKAVAWTEKNLPDDKELACFRTEAQQLIGPIQPSKPKPNRPPPPPFPEPTHN